MIQAVEAPESCQRRLDHFGRRLGIGRDTSNRAGGFAQRFLRGLDVVLISTDKNHLRAGFDERLGR